MIHICQLNRLWNETKESLKGRSSVKHLTDKTKPSTNLQLQTAQKLCNLTVLQDKKLWQDQKFEDIPKPLTERALFMNSVLEGYYKCQWKWSKNTKEVLNTKGFHSEGRRQYDIKKRINDLSESYFSVMDQKKASLFCW